MPGQAFDYAIVRVVPRVERHEHLNAGVIVCCPTAEILACRIHLDRARLSALAPGADADTIGRHLEALRAVCHGDPEAGPIAALPLRERFHWLVHPRSTVVQVSAVHAGIGDDLHAALDRLLESCVR